MLFDLDFKELKLKSFKDAKVDVKVLSVEAYQSLIGLVMGAGNSTSLESLDQAAFLKIASKEEVLPIARNVFKNHVSNLSGIEIRKEGEVKNLTSDELLDHSIFFPAVLEIIIHLFTISSLGVEEGKKSKNS